jgi:hypothetical protein
MNLACFLMCSSFYQAEKANNINLNQQNTLLEKVGSNNSV